MSIIAYTVARPLPGKRQAAESRVRQVAGIYARLGASVKPTRFVAGPHADCLGLLRGYPDFKAAVKTFSALSTDPAYVEFQEERETNPVFEIVSGRNISRRIFGEGKWPTHPVTLMRSYDLKRDMIPNALKLLTKIATLVGKSKVNLVGLAPVTGDDMSSLTAAYQFHSMEHLAEALDTVGASDAMQSLIAKACDFGTLRSAGIMVPL